MVFSDGFVFDESWCTSIQSPRFYNNYRFELD